MELYKVAVEASGRSVELILKAGIVATAEFGSHKDKVREPQDRILAMVGEGSAGLAAWVQVGRYDAAGQLSLIQEGWIAEGGGQLEGFKGSPVPATLSRIADPTAEMLACQKDSEVGAMDCCIEYGSNCYVRCCNSCCADPYGCPGASCCG